MSYDIPKTLTKVINDQACRLGRELSHKYTIEQAQFLSRHCVASIYGFEHWANMLYFIKHDDDPLSHPHFEHVSLHPKTIESNGPEFINFWNNKKEKLQKVLQIKPSQTECSFKEQYQGDELTNYLAKMYGFNSMAEVWINLKFHLEYKKKYYSLFDEKNKELLLQIDFIPKDSEFLQELIINQLDFGKTLAVAPKEWFKYEFDCSTISTTESYSELCSFHAWTVNRLTNLFLTEIESKFGKYITFNDAKNLLETIIPILMYDNSKEGLPITMNSFCEILKLKNLLLILGDDYYPKALQFLVRQYLESIGHVFSATYSSLERHVQQKHDQCAMLISHTVFSLSALMESSSFSISDDMKIIDAESFGTLCKFEQSFRKVNLANEVIENLAMMENESMVIIFDSHKNPMTEKDLEPIRDYCKMRDILFVLIQDHKNNNFNISNCASINQTGEIIDLILDA